MNKNEKFVITINRELGSGGRTVGYLNNSLSKAPLARTDRDILAETVSAIHERGIKVYSS